MTEARLVGHCSRRETGNVFVLVLLLLIPLAALAGTAITLGSREAAEQDAERARAIALMNAESGLDRALAQVLTDPDDFTTIELVSEQDASVKAHVEFENLGEDDVDNDNDGAVDESDETHMIRITSTGAINVDQFDEDGNPIIQPGVESYTKRVRALAIKSGEFPSFPFAVYLGDPLAEIQMNGNAFAIDGHDHTATAALSAGTAVPGIATTGTTTNITGQLSGPQSGNVTGEGANPSVKTVTPIDLQAIIDTYKPSADITFSGTTMYNGNLGDFEAGELVVTYATGNLKISGGGKGAGLLLVEGNLEITGNWEYRGVIVVTGQATFRGGGSGKRCIGSVLVGGDFYEGGSSEDLEVSGTIDVLFSSEMTGLVGDSLSGFTLTGWQEL